MMFCTTKPANSKTSYQLHHPAVSRQLPVKGSFVQNHPVNTSRMRCGILLAVCLSTLTACATRQVTDTVSGSSAQRLVTYSIEKFVPKLLAAEELNLIDNKRVFLRTHFLNNYALLDYATELLAYRLRAERGVVMAAKDEPRDYDLDVFFNSMGTDNDSYGLSVPTFGVVASADSRISLLAIDRYHGITEGYACSALHL